MKVWESPEWGVKKRASLLWSICILVALAVACTGQGKPMPLHAMLTR